MDAPGTHVIPTIDQVRSHGSVPQWFGLGFIQVDLPARRRLHFWVPDWPTIDDKHEQWHDHRYDFVSHVLKGEVFNRPAQVGALSATPFEGCLEVIGVHCKPAKSQAPARIGFCLMHEGTEERIGPGEQYSMPNDLFHMSRSSPGTVTLLERGPQVRSVARVIQPVGYANTCPFSVSFCADECWDRIRDILAA